MCRKGYFLLMVQFGGFDLAGSGSWIRVDEFSLMHPLLSVVCIYAPNILKIIDLLRRSSWPSRPAGRSGKVNVVKKVPHA